MPREQTTLGAFDGDADGETGRQQKTAGGSRERRDEWPSRWTCPDCEYSAEYELHARVAPTCPACLPGDVRPNGEPVVRIYYTGASPDNL